MAGVPKLLCPHCGDKSLRIRSSEQFHPLLKSLWLQCINLHCGFTCGGNIEITYQISPSAIPNPEIQLKTLDQIKADQKTVNDEFFNAKNK